MATDGCMPARPQSAPPAHDAPMTDHDGSWSEPATSPGRAQHDLDPMAFAHAQGDGGANPHPPAKDFYRRERASSDTPSMASNTSSTTTDTSDSGSSSGSDSTLTPSAFARQDSPTIPMAHPRVGPLSTRPDALVFLDEDSPVPTRESIQASFRTATAHRRSLSTSSGSSPSNRSTASSGSSSFGGDPFADGFDHETDYHTSPERSPQSQTAHTPAVVAPRGRGGRPQHLHPHPHPHQQPAAYWGRERERRYGTPEMPRGTADLPHLPQNDLTPRAHTYGGHPKHLPRAEKLPLSGYEMLAAHLTYSSQALPGGPQHRGGGHAFVRPMYRRFEALNHRLLLHLQDELCELEEQLHRLDTADTQNRRLQNGILPASRRADFQTAGELQWHKTDVLGKIGFKLEQYNHVLSSFQSTQSLPAPSPADIHNYRTYLAAHAPIVEPETRFLDAGSDLVCLDVFEDHVEEEEEEYDDDDEASRAAEEYDDNGTLTPLPPPLPDNNNNSNSPFPHELPQQPHAPHSPSPSALSALSAPPPPPAADTEAAEDEARRAVLTLGLAMAAALLLPVLLFTVIPGYGGRVMVALLVGLGAVAVVAQDRALAARFAPADWCAGLAVHGLVMAAVAGVCR